MSRDKIRLSGMTLYGYHGALESERELGQKLELDIELEADLSAACASDDLKDTINYESVYTLVAGTVEQERYHLLETLAETISRRILAEFPVQSVRLTIGKNNLPFPNQMSQVEISIERSAGDGAGQDTQDPHSGT